MTNNTTITRFEELTINEWPALHTLTYDGWIIRLSNGYTNRANSVSPLYGGFLDVIEKIRVCEEIYFNQGLDAIFKVTSASQPKELDEILESKGYSIGAYNSVQTLNLDRIPALDSSGNEVILFEELSDEWLSAFCRMSDIDDKKKETANKMLSSIVMKSRQAAIRSTSGEIIACAMAVLDGDEVGLIDVVTDRRFRRRGNSERLLVRLLHWARGNGAKTAYLQVNASYEPANRLYAKLGFREIYQYWYRIKKHP